MGDNMSIDALRALRNLLRWEAEAILEDPKLEGNKQQKAKFEKIYKRHLYLGKKLAAKGITTVEERVLGDARMEELSIIIENRYAPILKETQLRHIL